MNIKPGFQKLEELTQFTLANTFLNQTEPPCFDIDHSQKLDQLRFELSKHDEKILEEKRQKQIEDLKR